MQIKEALDVRHVGLLKVKQETKCISLELVQSTAKLPSDANQLNITLELLQQIESGGNHPALQIGTFPM